MLNLSRHPVRFLVLLALTLGVGVGLGVEGTRRWPFESLVGLIPAKGAELPAGWGRFPTGPGPRYESTVAVVGDHLYVLGGFVTNQLDAGADVFRFDRTAGQWTQLRDMPTPVTHRNAAVAGDTVWLAGGFVGRHPGQVTDEGWVYLTPLDEWRRASPLPAPRGGGVLAVLGDSLHYVGGYGPTRDTHVADHWRIAKSDFAAGRAAWQTAAPLPSARGHAAGVVVDGRLYVLGGVERHDPVQIDVAMVDRYDPATDRWEAVAPLPRPRSHTEPGTFVHRGRIWVVGGRSRPAYRQQLADVTVYDPATGRWRAEAPLPEPRMAPIAVALGDTVVAGLGSTDDRDRVPDLWFLLDRPGWRALPALPVALGEVAAAVLGDRLIVVGQGDDHTVALDLATGDWEPLGRIPRRPAADHHHAAEVVDGRLYLIGGLGLGAGVVQIFDPASNRWAFGPDVPFQAGSSASAVIDGQIHIVGGIDGDSTVASHAKLDPTAGRWTMLRPMPRPRNHAAAASDGRRLYIFGGRGPGSGAGNTVANGYADVQVYDPGTDTWTASGDGPGSPAPMPQGRGGMGKAVHVGGEFYLIGGETKDGPGATADGVYDRVDIYDPRANRWRDGPKLPSPRHGIYPVLLDDRIIVVGGGTRAGRSASSIATALVLPAPR
ncbi:MAG: Kelch repeat-containing protein [Gemmatimonadales bacterium]